MSDPNGPVPPPPYGAAPPPPASAADPMENLRLTAVIGYGLFIAVFVSVFFTAVAGVILAYVKRGDARGTVYESHFDNLISVFWVTVIVGIVAIPLLFIGVGFVIYAILVVWYLYRTIKGLVTALDGRPYA